MLNRFFVSDASKRLGTRLSPSIFCAVAAFALMRSMPHLAYGQVSVLTQHNDNSRTGQNLNETLLTPANVNSTLFGKLFSYSVDGFVVGQPLYLQGVSIPGLGTHNVVYVATQHDSVFAFDADSNLGSNTPLWGVSFLNPAGGVTTVPISIQGCKSVNGFNEVGIMGTPVIDPTTGTLYVSVKTMENGSYVHRLHALDVTNGQEKFGGPVVITASITGTKGVINFNTMSEIQRPGLLLANGVVYIAFGSNGCDRGARGWLLAYDSTSLQQVGVFTTTPDAPSPLAEGSIWQSGGGPGSDANGFVYFMSANGLFDANSGGQDFGDSFLKLSLGAGGLTWTDYFTPYNQATLYSQDLDLGSGGVLLLPDQPGSHPHLIIGAGKQGTIYLVDCNNMGHYNASGDSQIVQELTGAVTGMWSGPAYWNNTVYFTGTEDYVKAFSLSSGLLSSTPAFESQNVYQNMSFPSISANGSSGGILWAVRNPANPALMAFSAADLALIYDSGQVSARDALGAVAHFVKPTIANGRVYVGTQTQLVVYGLFPTLSVSAGNNQTGTVGTTLPVALQVLASDPYSGNPYPGVTVAFSDGGKGGSFGSATVTTNSSGIASTSYTLPQKPVAALNITATSTGYVGTSFTVTATVGPPAFRGGSGGNQTAPVSSPLPNPLVYRVADAYYNPVPGVLVTFDDGGAGGSFSATTLATNKAGTATVTYTTPASSGTVKITASASGLSPLVYTETVAP